MTLEQQEIFVQHCLVETLELLPLIVKRSWLDENQRQTAFDSLIASTFVLESFGINCTVFVKEMMVSGLGLDGLFSYTKKREK